jgi:uncharacterized alpha-E superfamily protein
MLSRVADSLYWMSRYLERAEHSARLLQVNLDLILDTPTDQGLPYWSRLYSSLNMPISRMTLENNDPFHMTHRLAFDATNSASIVACVAHARENARQVREQISSEMWEQINRLFLYVNETGASDRWEAEPHGFFREVKEGVHLFQGITDSTMNHNQGWYFIHVGRYIERSINTTTLLHVHYHTLAAHPDASDLEWTALLKCCTAFEAYCKVYTADIDPNCIAEFLVLDQHFPHSICFSVDMLQNSLKSISDLTSTRKSGKIHRLAGRLQSSLEYSQIDEIMSSDFFAYLQDIREQCAQLHTTIYQTYIEYIIDQDVLLL